MTIGEFTSLWVFDRTDLEKWLDEAELALKTLQSRTGFVSAQVGRSPDEPSRLIVTTKWSDVGSYRRALSSSEAKMSVWPFLADMHDEPSAFEVLLSAEGEILRHFKSSLQS
jgi:quinol monooxygenase YgiN